MTVVEFFYEKAEACLKDLSAFVSLSAEDHAAAIICIAKHLRSAAQKPKTRIISRRICGKNKDLIKMLKLEGIACVEITCTPESKNDSCDTTL